MGSSFSKGRGKVKMFGNDSIEFMLEVIQSGLVGNVAEKSLGKKTSLLKAHDFLNNIQSRLNHSIRRKLEHLLTDDEFNDLNLLWDDSSPINYEALEFLNNLAYCLDLEATKQKLEKVQGKESALIFID